MVDNFVLALTHGLLALAAWRLILRVDLDRDPDGEESRPGAISSRMKSSGASKIAASKNLQAKQAPRA
jgi:hypothetical protein